jgi:type I restriction enzyme S subunit
MSKNKNVPELRFKEFSDEWELKKLNQLLELKNGINADKEKYGKGVKFINVLDILENDFITHDKIKGSVEVDDKTIELFSVNYGDILFQRSSETREEVGTANVYLDEKVSVTFGGFVIRGKKIGEYEPIFFNKLLKTDLARNEITSRSGGSTRYNIGQEILYSISLPFPSLREQTKIASFLTSVDDKLRTIKKKKTLLEQYKKGVMQKLFSQELRFKDEKGNDFPEWEEKKLGDVAKRKTLKNKEGNSNVLTISAQYGLISQLEFFNKSVSAKDVSGYYLVEKGDFAYNKSYSNGYPMGAIKRLKRYEKGVVSTLYICFTFNENIDLAFMEHYFDMGIQNKEIELVAQEGARNHGLLNIGIEDFFGIQLYLPSIPEQIKIAYFLTSIDEKINQTQFQIEKTESWKKGLLQKMFV